MPTLTDAREALEALEEPWLEQVLVGRSLCLHQPITRAVALVPDVAREGAVAALPSWAELVASGLVLPSSDESASAAGTVAISAPERPWCGAVGSRYRVSGGAVVSLACDCAWLGPRLEAVLAPVACGGGCYRRPRGHGHDLGWS
jgi:hypothetical protein